MKPGRERQLKGKGLEGLFELIFYRKPSVSSLAKRFVEYLELKNSGDGMHVSEWKNWIKQNNVTQKQFYDIVNKLRGVGMIRRERDHYTLSRDFSRMLNEMADIWDAWRESMNEDRVMESA